MEPKFYLKEPHAKKETLVFFVFHLFGYRAKRSTGIKILPMVWNFKYCRVKPLHPDSDQINRFLDKLEDRAKVMKLQAITTMVIPSPDQFLDSVFEITKPDFDLFDKFDQFKIQTSKRSSQKSLKALDSVKSSLRQFNPKLSDLKQKTLDAFIDWMIDKKYSPNYIEKQTGILSRFCKYLNLPYNPTIKIPRKKTDSIALNIEEVRQLINCKNLTPDLENIRDVFVFGCFTGLRYSDVKLFNPDYIQVIDNVRCIVFYAQKTGNKSVIPIFPEVEAILKRYKGNLPKRLSSQKFNNSLKMVCRIAGFASPVQIAKLKGMGKEIEVKPKYEAITSHTMRRTFITIMSVHGLTPKEISLMSGHAQQSIVDIYDKTKADTNAVKVFQILKGRV